jgi:L-glutamine-phosphate cytidylyltransferase
MKAIIIAAGMGKRLLPYTKNKPKCMLEIGEKPLIKHQADILTSLGIKEIHVVKGYKQEAFDTFESDFKYYVNDNYQNNNILESLFYAEPEINGDVVILYSDIIFNKQVVEKLLESKEEISIVVDVDWEVNYIGRQDHPITEAESVIFDTNGYVQKIGKTLGVDKDLISGEFIGMLMLRGDGANTLKRFYHENRKKCQGGSFQKAVTFSKAYITDIIQELVDCSVKVSCVQIHNGWKEIDTMEDFRNATALYQDMGLG